MSPPRRSWSPHEHYCHVFGPGASPTFYWEITWFVVQAGNVWVAFLYLPYSSSRAGGVIARSTKGQMLQEDNGDYRVIVKSRLSAAPSGFFFRLLDRVLPDGDFSRGGVLRPWILYDLRCFGLCLLWAAISAWRHGLSTPRFEEEEWQFRATLWWCKALYGLLSMPFVVFLLPGLGAALTHARPTGYNRNGECVRRLTAAERRQLLKERAKKGAGRQAGARAQPQPEATATPRALASAASRWQPSE